MIYIVYKTCIDNSEDEVSAAITRQPIGATVSREIAESYSKSKAVLNHKDCWAISLGHSIRLYNVEVYKPLTELKDDNISNRSQT